MQRSYPLCSPLFCRVSVGLTNTMPQRTPQHSGKGQKKNGGRGVPVVMIRFGSTSSASTSSVTSTPSSSPSDSSYTQSINRSRSIHAKHIEGVEVRTLSLEDSCFFFFFFFSLSFLLCKEEHTNKHH